MYLKRLELTGFKSFASSTILEFDKPQKNRFNISAIIGPNGSGKSNLAESVRWALGEQSIKMLRGKKLEDIIFAGSKQKMRLNVAEVVLFFDNENGFAPVDYKEFTITRRIYRNGESEYRINKSRVKLQDILILLARANFGQKSYSIVGQGMIDSILTASPVERKKFFDEATGIKQHMYKRDTAIRKIEKSKDNLHQANIALNEISPRLKSLTRQINKLSRRKQIETKLYNLQRKYYGSLWQDLYQQISVLKKQCETKIKKQKQIEKELKNYQQESKNLVYEEPDKQYQKMQKQHSGLIKRKNEYLSKQSMIRAQIIFEQEKIKQDKEINILSIDQEKIFTGLKKIESLQEELLKKINKVSKINEIETIKISAQNIFQKIKQVLHYFASEKKQVLVSNKNTIEKIQKQEKELDQKIKDLNKKLVQLNNNLFQFTKKEQEKRKKLLAWQEKIQDKQYHLISVNNSINELKVELVRLETKKEGIETEIKNEMNISTDKIFKSFDNTSSEPVDFNEIQKLKHQLDLIGGIDPEIEKEYPLVRERYEFLHSQTNDLQKSLRSLHKVIAELDQKIKDQFKKSFSQINQEFDHYFKVIFGGGGAKIVVQESSDILTQESENSLENESKTLSIAGIEILATPPGKKIKGIEMLSGGEKALASLSLICAIIAINKPPFVVLDEVDAALDQENSFRFVEILKELRKHTQFIIITHNQQTIEIADLLYGITMGRDGVSKLISLKLEK